MVRIKQIALGILHFSKQDYLSSTPYEVILAYEGWSEVEKQREDAHMMRTRVLGYLVYSSIPEKGRKKSIDSWWPLGDKKIPTKVDRLKKYEKLNGKI